MRRINCPRLPDRWLTTRGGQLRYQPSTFLTLTLDSYRRVDAQGAAIDPQTYDHRRAARDAIHFPALVDRFWRNTRRCVGWDVQYFGTVERRHVPRVTSLGVPRRPDHLRGPENAFNSTS